MPDSKYIQMILDDYFLKTLTSGQNSYSSVLYVCISLDNECFPQETKSPNTRWNPICFRHLRTHFQNSQGYFVYTHTHTHTHTHTRTTRSQQRDFNIIQEWNGKHKNNKIHFFLLNDEQKYKLKQLSQSSFETSFSMTFCARGFL